MTPAEALRQQIGWIVVAVILLMGVVAHAMLPRYEWRSYDVSPTTHVLILYDRWGGVFQRATFDEAGKIHLSEVYVAP
jgi:hypothetical protein